MYYSAMMIDKTRSLLCSWNNDARNGSRVRTISPVDGFHNVIDDGFIHVNNSLRVLNLINKALRRIPTSGLCDMHSRRLQNPFKDLMNHTDYFLFHVDCWPQSVLRHCRQDGRRHTYSLPHNWRISQLRASQKSDPLSKMHSICSIWTEIKVALTHMAR